MVGLALWSLSSMVFAQCVVFPLTTGRFNLPITQVEMINRAMSFVFDLGMSHALALDERAYRQLAQGKTSSAVMQSDITGQSISTSQLNHQKIKINGFTFNDITVTQAKPWGAVLSAKAPVDMPMNTIGLGLFKNKGVMLYSRKDAKVKWCESHLEIENIQWQPLQIDSEGIHLKINNTGWQYDFVLDSASTNSIIRRTKSKGLSPCDVNQHYECQRLDIGTSNKPCLEQFYIMDLPENFESDGLLGDSFFQHHDIVMDTINQRLGLIHRT